MTHDDDDDDDWPYIAEPVAYWPPPGTGALGPKYALLKPRHRNQESPEVSPEMYGGPVWTRRTEPFWWDLTARQEVDLVTAVGLNELLAEHRRTVAERREFFRLTQCGSTRPPT